MSEKIYPKTNGVPNYCFLPAGAFLNFLRTMAKDERWCVSIETKHRVETFTRTYFTHRYMCGNCSESFIEEMIVFMGIVFFDEQLAKADKGMIDE